MRQTETTVYAKRRMIWIKTDIESAGRMIEGEKWGVFGHRGKDLPPVMDSCAALIYMRCREREDL
jgi:hypothetical protein